MISFIAIGKNEGPKLKRCFASCKQFAISSGIEAELIYVDSQSTDDSIKIAREFKVDKILSLPPPCNAAKARNLGAQNAKGETLIFVDGDMVLYPEFGKKIIKNNTLVYPFINGQRIDIFYDEQGKYIEDNRDRIEQITEDTFKSTTGGLFAIAKDLWNEVNGMDNNLKCFEDNDLAYRIYRKKGIKIFNVGSIFAEHHTINYTNKGRYKDLAKGNYFLFKGVIFRKHFFSKILPFLLLRNLSFTFLVISLLLAIIFLQPIFLLIYIAAMFAKLFFIKSTSNSTTRFARFFIDIFIDFKVLIGLLFFFPKKY